MDYKNIASIEYRATTLLKDYYVSKEIGKKYTWKLFGLFPAYNYVAQTNICKKKGLLHDKECYDVNIVVKDGKVYSKPRVIIKYKSGTQSSIWFNTEADAIRYLMLTEGNIQNTNKNDI